MPRNSAVGDGTMHELQIPPGLIDPVHSPATTPAVHLEQPWGGQSPGYLAVLAAHHVAGETGGHRPQSSHQRVRVPPVAVQATAEAL